MVQTEHRQADKPVIGVLYGFRALMVLFVCNFHFWQQGWLGQYVTVFGRTVDFDYWTRSSYVFVDGMMLLSAWLLYLPYARQAAYGTPVPSVGRFYFSRATRILPSYFASVFILLFCVALPNGQYRDAAARNMDVLTHLTFTFTFWKETYLYTPLNVVLWTVAIEMQFYLVFPFLARAARRTPWITLLLMGATGVLFRAVLTRQVSDLSLLLNQMPAFLDVYALGMLGAIAYVTLKKRLDASPSVKLRRGTATIATGVFIAGCFALSAILREQTNQGLISHDSLRLSQWALRLPLATVLLGLMLSAAFLPRVLQKLLDNRLMRFLSTISFNLYIWHQILSVLLARNLFPATLHDDLPLQQAFTLLCYTLSIAVAMAATYGLEQPAARVLERFYRKHFQKKESIRYEGSTGTETLPPADPLLVRDAQGGAGVD